MIVGFLSDIQGRFSKLTSQVSSITPNVPSIGPDVVVEAEVETATGTETGAVPLPVDLVVPATIRQNGKILE